MTKKIYILTEEFSSYDDSWSMILDVFEDKDSAKFVEERLNHYQNKGPNDPWFEILEYEVN